MNSDKIKKGIQRAPHRSLLRACGLEDQDFEKPFIGIGNSYTNVVPGHVHLDQLGAYARDGVKNYGGTPFLFDTMAICDGISMNHEGMKYSLPSREIIAATIESMAKAHPFDGLILIASCDKVVPGMIMGAIRVDIPTVIVTGGPMEAGVYKDENVDLISVFEAVGANSAGKISDEEVYELEKAACPGPGSCAGLFTANTMACITETLGLSYPKCATVHANSQDKRDMCYSAGQTIMELIEKDIKISDILTQESFNNAIIIDMALGGSSNTALHLPAIANEIEGINVDLDLFDEISRKVPHIASISPAGKHTMMDLHNAGGIPGVIKTLEGIIDTNQLTITGKTIAENINEEKFEIDREVIHPLDNPVHKDGGIAILKGNLAPNGSVVKKGAVADNLMHLKGPAKVYNSEEEVTKAIFNHEIQEEDIIVIRYEGPKGGPGMREMLNPTSALAGMQIKDVGLITDGRFSGGTRGPCVGHVSPEALENGPIAAIQNGDIIEIDINNRLLNVELSDEEIQKRLENVKHPKSDVSGWLALYQKLVHSADTGAILR